MNRRSLLRFLGLAPIAVPAALAALPLNAYANSVAGRVVATEGLIEGQATAIQSLTTRIGDREAKLTSYCGSVQSTVLAGDIDGQKGGFRFGNDGQSYRLDVLPDAAT